MRPCMYTLPVRFSSVQLTLGDKFGRQSYTYGLIKTGEGRDRIQVN
jgi:hypothetical protein